MDSTIQQLKSFVRQRLHAVARDIMAEVEKNMMLAQRESEVSQPKEKAESQPHRESLPEKPVEEPPQTSFTVDHGDNYDAPPLQQKKQMSSAPEASNFSQSNDIPGPSETPADGNSNKWNCPQTDFTSDMKKGQEKQKKEDRKLDEIVFPSVQFLKDEDKTASLASSCAEEDSMDGISIQPDSHTAKQKRKPVPCSVCGKSYTFGACLVKHMKEHMAETDCKVCGKKRESIEAMVKHVKVKHPLMFCCDICGRVFDTKKALIHHKIFHNRNKENV